MASTRSDYNIHIRAHDAFTKTMLKAEGAVRGLQNTAQTMQKHWLALGATALAVGKAWDLANRAAVFDQQEQAFSNLAASHHANAQTIIKDLEMMSAGTVSTANIMQSAGKAMLLGIPAEKLKGMMEIARAASRVTGDTVQKSFDDIATGMGRQSKLILDNLGIIIKVEEANKAYAKEMGIVGRALTDVEKKTAFMNATLAAGEDIVRRVGVRGLTASEAMAKFTATVQNFGIVMGKVIITIVSFTGAALTAFSAVINGVIGLIVRGLEKMVGMLAKIPGAGKFLDPIKEGLKAVADHQMAVTDEAVRMTLAQQEVGLSIWETKKAIDGMNRSMGETPAAVEQSLEAQKKIAALLAKKGPGVQTAATAELEGLDPEQAQMASRLVELQTFHDNKMAMLAEAGASEAQMKSAFLARDLALEKQKEEATIALKRNGLGMAAGFLGNMATLSGKHGKKMFKAQQAMQIAQATMDGISAVQGAFKWGNIVGGPVVGFAFAAAAFAAQAANIKAIASASPGGGGGGGASTGGGSVPAGPGIEATPVKVEDATQQAAPTRDIKIIIQTATGDIPKETLAKIRKGLTEDARDLNETLDEIVFKGNGA